MIIYIHLRAGRTGSEVIDSTETERQSKKSV